MISFPVLAKEIERRGIKKTAIAKSLGICDKSLYSKLNGITPFTWPEVKTIVHQFFPDLTPDELFECNVDCVKGGENNE